MTVRDYSTTANDNTTIEGIALADTMLANALDNAIRQEMADTANFLLDIAKPTATTGSANAYILTTGGTVDAYADKVRLAIRPNFSNTGACTINVDTVGVVDLKIYTSSGAGDPASGQIQSGGVYDILYVDALGDFVVLNPTPTTHATGDMLAANNLSDVSSASTAFTNIKQAATTSATGVVEKATTSEAQGGTTGDKFMDDVLTKAAILALSPISANEYESSGQTITSSGGLTLAHGLGAEPRLWMIWLECTTADGTWEVGDKIETLFNSSTSAQTRINTVSFDATNVYIHFTDNSICFQSAPEGGGAKSTITNASWDLYVRAWA